MKENVDLNGWIRAYVHSQQELLDRIPVAKLEAVVDVLRQLNREGRQLVVFGNGGSAASASHFITDLGKGVSGPGVRKFKVRSLNESIAWMTAIGNDYSYEELFTRQLENFAQPGDAILLMSVSGNSPNLLHVVRWAKEHGVIVIAFTGEKPTPLSELADYYLPVPSLHYGRVEDAHMFMCHLLAYAFMENPALLQD